MEILRNRNKELGGIETFSRWGLIGIVFSFISIILALFSLVRWASSAQSHSNSDISSSGQQGEFILAQIENNSENVSRLQIGDRFSSIAPSDYGKTLPIRNLIENDWSFYQTNERINEYSFVVEPIYQPKQVFVFINLENGYSVINGQNIIGQQIGHIEFEFTGTQTLSYPLIAGENIREWLVGANKDIVKNTSASNSHEVYIGKHYKDENMAGILDLIAIGFNNLPSTSPLVRIKIFDETLSVLASDNPRFIIMGVVVEK